MNKSKILIAVGAVTLGVIIGIVYMNLMEADYINEDEVRAIVTDRYQGDISNVSLSDNDNYFLVTVDDEQHLYEITINREEGTVVDLTSSENPDYVEETDTENTESGGGSSEETASSEESSPDEEETASNDTESDDTQSDDTEQASDGSDIISVEEARDIALNEVGGVFLHSTLNEQVSPNEYLIAYLIDGDDEGAIVSINALNGTINKVIFLDIEFDEIGDLESFMRQVASYNAQNQQYYIEYDDWDDDNEWDEDDSDDDWDDD